MTDARDLHRRAGALAAGVIARIPAGQLGAPTPCTDWDVRALINHVTGGNLRFAALLAGEPGPDRIQDVLGGDPLAAFRDSFSRLAEAFDRPGILDQVFPTPIGEGPGSMLVGMRTAELTMHSWDLAVATGQPRDFDPELVAFAEGRFRALPLPRAGQGPFAPEQPAPEGAGQADRMAAFAGRSVPADLP